MSQCWYLGAAKGETRVDAIREKLLGFLSAGASQTVAASAAGCSDTLVSQIVREPEFLAALQQRQAGKLASNVQHDDTIESAEARALEALNSKLMFVKDPMQAARIFQILNSAKKRVMDPTHQSPESVQQVTIVLPRAAAARIQINSQSQVIEVEGRSMATLPSRSLPALQKQREVERAELLLEQVQMTTVINGVVAVL